MATKTRKPRALKPLKVFAYRDFLGGEQYNYFGVTIYVVSRANRAPDTIDRAREVLADELTSYIVGSYEESGLSVASIDDIPGGARAGDIVFEVGELKSGKFRYYGHYSGGEWVSLKIFPEFDIDALTDAIRDVED